MKKTIKIIVKIFLIYIFIIPLYINPNIIKVIVEIIIVPMHILSLILIFSFKNILLTIFVSTEYKELIDATILINPKFKAKEYKTLPIGVKADPLIILKLGFSNFLGLNKTIIKNNTLTTV
jgi:hypothetical protein